MPFMRRRAVPSSVKGLRTKKPIKATISTFLSKKKAKPKRRKPTLKGFGKHLKKLFIGTKARRIRKLKKKSKK